MGINAKEEKEEKEFSQSRVDPLGFQYEGTKLNLKKEYYMQGNQ